MSTTYKTWIGALGSSLFLSLCTARADLEVGASVSIHTTADFYAPLESQGAWVEIAGHGRCWHPVHVALDWRPYCEGHWVWTDCGWYWMTDEPWGWACYHYGSWMTHPDYGWVWVPAVEWAPAWVSWRVGGGYVGWAPLPPPRVTVIGPQFVFVANARFHENVRPSTVTINNTAVIAGTKEVNNVRRETRPINGGAPQRIVFNEGPGLEPMQKATANRVSVVAIHQAVQQTHAPTLRPGGALPQKSEQLPPPGQSKVVPNESRPGPAEKTTPQPVEKRAGDDAVRPAPQPPPETQRPEQPRPDRPPGHREHPGKSHGKPQPLQPPQPQPPQPPPPKPADEPHKDQP